jgi:lactate racemase
MMVITQAVAQPGQLLAEDVIRQTLENGLAGKFTQARVLVLIPDHTRSIPLPLLFRLMVEILADARKVDFMVALGTHPPLSEEALCKRVGITPTEWSSDYAHIGLLNHAWENPETLAEIGVITDDQLRELAGTAWHPSLAGDILVRINRAALEYDEIIILGPTFPHEVVGFSGGAKYLFPGISGPEMINKTHWLGALITTMKVIGYKDTPVRDVIHAAAGLVKTPITLVSVVVEKDGLAGMFIGDYVSAFNAAADLSSQRHIVWIDKPYRRILATAPAMYDELWTAGKAMYKMEPAVAEGGELIIYAPHLDTVSHVHGKYIYQMGYHVLDYFLKQWSRFEDFPKGVLAHSTHVKGIGRFEDEVETPRITVTLASRISPEDCKTLNLGYLNPEEVNIRDWQNREEEGLLYVPKAGEMLYRVRDA